MIQLLKPCAVRLRPQKRGYDAYASALRWHALTHIHAKKPPCGNYMQKHKVQKALHQLRHRQKQQQRRKYAAAKIGRKKADEKAQKHVCAYIAALSKVALLFKEEKAHMAALLPRLFHEVFSVYVLLCARFPGKPFHALEICLSGTAVHAGIVSGKLSGEDGVCDVHIGYELFHVQHGEKPQGGEKLLQGPLWLKIGNGAAHPPAHFGDSAYDSRAQCGGQRFKLCHFQHCHRLKALHIQPQPLLRKLAPARKQHGAAKGRHHKPVPAAAKMSR